MPIRNPCTCREIFTPEQINRGEICSGCKAEVIALVQGEAKYQASQREKNQN